MGTEGASPPYGYPGPAPNGFNEVDPGASAWGFVPQIRKAHLELTHGELPLWNANVMLGAPLAADAVHGLFNPLTWPLVADPKPGVWDVWLLSRLLLAGLLCTSLALYLGLRGVAATVAGLIYMMSGVFQLRTSTIQTGVMALLPLLILAIELCVRRPSRWSSGLLAIAVALTILFGMPEESFVCLTMAAVYFTVRLAATWRHSHRYIRARVAFAGVGGSIIGLLISLPLLLPFIEYVRASVNGHGPSSHPALQVEDGRQILSLVGPHWNMVGPRGFVGSVAPMDNWFGVGALYLVALGVFSTALPRGVRTLLVVTAVAVEAKVVGFPGWYNTFIGNAPVVGRIALWAYSGVLVSLAIALLAGAGLHRLELRAVRPRTAIAAGLVLAAVIASAAPAFLAGTTIRWNQILITGVILAVVLAGTLIALGRTAWGGKAGLLLAAGAVAAELILLATPEVPLPVRYDSLSPTPATAYLQRVMPSGSGRSYSATGILYPTTNQAFNLDDVRNLDPIYIERSYRYLKLFVVPGLTDRFDGVGPNAASITHNRFLDVLNVEYILVAPSAQPTPTDLPADQYTPVTALADGVRIYRNRDSSPRAQLVFDAATADSAENAVAIMKRPGFDPTRTAVVETSHSLPTGDHPPIPAHIDSYDDSRVVMTTSATEPGVLVLADAYYPGWEADLDGKPTTIYPVDLALRGVLVPPGTHTVTMRYQPGSLEAGAFGLPAGLVGFGLGGWAVPATLRAVQRRRQRPTE